MSSLVLDPLQRITRSVFHRDTAGVAAFCDESQDNRNSYEWLEAFGTGPYIHISESTPRTMPWWFDDVQEWESVHEQTGVKGVIFDVQVESWQFPITDPRLVPEGEEAPEGVSVVDVSRPPMLSSLTQPGLRPAVSDYLAPGVDPRFYIFVDNSGSMTTEDIQPTLGRYLSRLREWRIPYRVIEIGGNYGVHAPTGLGGEQWLQWLCAPFVGGFNLGADVALEDWTP